MSSCIHNGLLWYNLVETERRAASLPGPAFWEKLLVSVALLRHCFARCQACRAPNSIRTSHPQSDRSHSDLNSGQDSMRCSRLSLERVLWQSYLKDWENQVGGCP